MEIRHLVAGPWSLELSGLDPLRASVLERRWGAFLSVEAHLPPAARIRLVDDPAAVGLPRWEPGERYRIEGALEGSRIVVRSYHFVLTGMSGGDGWTLRLADLGHEPAERVIENGLRYVAARLAAEAGGLAIHGAGVERDGRAHVFAGPSRSGKTTAVRLSAPARSLGDDLAVLLPAPEGEGWVTAAVPFDNAERGPADYPRGAFPVAGLWRLYPAEETSLDRPGLAAAAASLMACAAFPWAMPDLSGDLLERCARIAADLRFAHLRFTKDPGFWALIGD